MAHYRHTQPATLILSLVLGAAVLGAALVVVVARSDGWGMALIPVGFTLLMAGFAYVFSSLTVEVSRERVSLAFGPGWIRKRIDTREVVSATPVRNRWWYGWGIRITPHGWLYNVSGFDAVEIATADGKHLRIGTDDRAALADAINRVAPAAQPPSRLNAQ